MFWEGVTVHVVGHVFAGRLPGVFVDREEDTGRDGEVVQHRRKVVGERKGDGDGDAKRVFRGSASLARYVRKVVWQVECDMMKHFYVEDMCMDEADLVGLESVEFRVRSESWREGFLGEECGGRERFVGGREMVVGYGKLVGERMGGETEVVEDRRFLGRGCVIVCVRRKGRGKGRRGLAAHVSEGKGERWEAVS